MLDAQGRGVLSDWDHAGSKDDGTRIVVRSASNHVSLDTSKWLNRAPTNICQFNTCSARQRFTILLMTWNPCSGFSSTAPSSALQNPTRIPTCTFSRLFATPTRAFILVLAADLASSQAIPCPTFASLEPWKPFCKISNTPGGATIWNAKALCGFYGICGTISSRQREWYPTHRIGVRN